MQSNLSIPHTPYTMMVQNELIIVGNLTQKSTHININKNNPWFIWNNDNSVNLFAQEMFGLPCNQLTQLSAVLPLVQFSVENPNIWLLLVKMNYG